MGSDSYQIRHVRKDKKKKLSCAKELCRFNKYFGNSVTLKKAFFKGESFVSGVEPNPIGKVPDVESFINLQTTNFPCLEKNIFSAWCLDNYRPLYEEAQNIPNGSGITEYELLSIIDPQAPAVSVSKANICERIIPSPFITIYFPSIIFILNQVERYENILEYSISDIQTAIWNLVNNPDLTKIILYEPLSILANVQFIITESIAAQNLWNENGQNTCKYLATNNIMGLLAFPKSILVGQELTCYQILVIQLSLCQFNKLFENCPKKCHC